MLRELLAEKDKRNEDLKHALLLIVVQASDETGIYRATGSEKIVATLEKIVTSASKLPQTKIAALITNRQRQTAGFGESKQLLLLVAAGFRDECLGGGAPKRRIRGLKP